MSGPEGLLQRPPLLPARPVVRVVFPSGGFANAHRRKALKAGVRVLEQAGCVVQWDPARLDDLWRGYYAGPDHQRRDELLNALLDPSVDLIWCARGGGGASRIAEEVLGELSGQIVAPKPLIGFSDGTTLLNGLMAQVGWVVFHGPTVNMLGGRAEMVAQALAMLRSPRWLVEWAPVDGPYLHGPIVGGNLTVLASITGTRALAHLPGAIWLLEDVGEPRFRLDRSLQQLLRSDALSDAVGIWLGDLGLEGKAGTLQARAVEEDCSGVPVIAGAPAGHGEGALSVIPFGWPGTLSPAEGKWIGDDPGWV